jgi:hypothetical protein
MSARRTALLLLLAGLLTLLLVPAAAGAATRVAVVPTLTSPGQNATVHTSRPKFQWTLPASYDLVGVEAARSSAETDGFFPDPAWGAALADGTQQRTVEPAGSLWAGRWFWHVIGKSSGGVRRDSGTRSFVIPLVVKTPIISGTVTPRGLTSFRILGNMNSRNYRLELAVYEGATRCVSRIFAGELPRRVIAVTTVYATGNCYEAGNLPNNTRMRIVATAVSGSVRRSASKSYFT